MVQVMIKVRSHQVETELDSSTTLQEIQEFLLECEYIQKGEQIIVEVLGQQFRRGTETVESMIGGQTNATFLIQFVDKQQNNNSTQYAPTARMETDYGPPMSQHLQSAVWSQPPAQQQPQPVGQGYQPAQVQQGRQPFNPFLTEDNRISNGQSPNTNITNLPPVRLGQQQPNNLQQPNLCQLVFVHQQSQTPTTVRISSDKYVQDAIDLLAAQLGVSSQTLVVYDQNNKQLLKDGLQARLTHLPNSNNSTNQEQIDNQNRSRMIEMKFQIVNGNNRRLLTLKVDRTYSMESIKQDLMNNLGYRADYATLSYFLNGTEIGNVNKLSHTPEQLALHDQIIEVRVRWVGG